MGPRVLILTASIGEGHDLPARTLAAQLTEECPDVEIVTEDALRVLGWLTRFLSSSASSVVFYRFTWGWDLGFWVFARIGWTRGLAQRLLFRVGAPGMLALVLEVEPDVIVSVFPQATEVLGRLREHGLLDIPVVAGITDLAALHYWAQRGCDVHLITHPESVAELHEIAGSDAVVHTVHGFTAPEFLAPRTQADARAALGLPPIGKIVLVSGGGWGVGDVTGAVEEALEVVGVVLVVCLCGRNEDLRARLAKRFAETPRARIEGFTDVMPEWIEASDVLVHSTGGLTMLEALMRGVPAISYGWGRGHIRLNNAAYHRFDLAEVVSGRKQLNDALRGALAHGRLPVEGWAALPSAASFVLALAAPVTSARAPGQPV